MNQARTERYEELADIYQKAHECDRAATRVADPQVHFGKRPSTASKPIAQSFVHREARAQCHAPHAPVSISARLLRPECHTVPVPISVRLGVRAGVNQCQAANMTSP